MNFTSKGGPIYKVLSNRKVKLSSDRDLDMLGLMGEATAGKINKKPINFLPSHKGAVKRYPIVFSGLICKLRRKHRKVKKIICTLKLRDKIFTVAIGSTGLPETLGINLRFSNPFNL